MLQNEKIRLLDAWKNSLFADLSISEIMDISKKKTKPWVFNSLNELTENNLLIAKKKGNINNYQLNVDNPFLFQLLHYLNVQKNLRFKHLDLVQNIISNISYKNYVLLVLESEDKKKKNSDLDIVFLLDNKEDKKKIKASFNEITSKCSAKVKDNYLTYDEFIERLLNDKESLGRQIFMKSKIFYNSDIYYQLIKEAYKRGFR